jgi:long-subunit acyl-CoA synthetase (AMP-forming)
MNKKSPTRDEQLNKTIAETVFGWKNVRKKDGVLFGKKQDKAGRWRKAKVPDYAHDPRQAYAIDEHMKQVGRSERYLKELSRITKAKNLPTEWATPEQRCRAALKINPGYLRLIGSGHSARR